MKSSIAKYIVGGIIVVAIAAYAVWSGTNTTNISALPPVTASPSSGSVSGSGSASSAGATATGSSASTGAGTPPNSGASSGGGTTSGGTTSGGTASAGQYKDGTYTGSVADAFYGQVQVAVIVQGGKITNIRFPVYPSEPGHTSEISRADLPILAQEAIAAQSANVNIVSGATQTSGAFQQSLASALAQAK